MATNWTAWLGPAADEMTDEQRDRFEGEAAVIEARWPGEDLSDERDTALSAVVQYLVGETTANAAGQELARTRSDAASALIAAQTVARLAVLDGMPEAAAARATSLDRMTVRKALGKR